MRVSGFTDSLTAAGKPAPPMPASPRCGYVRSARLDPASRNRCMPVCSTHSSLPSVDDHDTRCGEPGRVRDHAFLDSGDSPGRGGVYGNADETPCASAIICPFSTCSPTATTGRAGAPMCCDSGITSSGGIPATAIGVRSDCCLFSRRVNATVETESFSHAASSWSGPTQRRHVAIISTLAAHRVG